MTTQPRTSSGRLPVRALVFLGTLLITTTGALGVPRAVAQEATVTDPANSSTAVDVRSATYVDSENDVSATVHLRRLAATGSLVLRVAQSQTGTRYYVATVTRNAAGTLGTRLERVTDAGRTTTRCAIDAAWSRATDTVGASVPQSCLRFGHFVSRHWMQARVRSTGEGDSAASRTVGRGDSPGCVTQAEFRAVRPGQLKAKVHAQLDTAGRFGDGGAGGYSRVYARCDHQGQDYIVYVGQSGTVDGKGRVR